MNTTYYIVRFIRRDNRFDEEFLDDDTEEVEEFLYVDTKEAEEFFNQYKHKRSKLYSKVQLLLSIGNSEMLISEIEFME